jgi:hypothetical protein
LDATGAWAGKSHCIAAWTSGGWRFIAPADGMSFYDRASGTSATFRNGAWEVGVLRAGSLLIDDEQVVGSRGAAIDSPSGGAVVDTEGRLAIEAILTAMRQHGLIAT